MLQQLFRSLHHANYRTYFAAQLISITGTWMQNVAQYWLVYRLTGSSVMLGVVSFASLVPVLLFGLGGGILADRFSRRKILIAAHTAAMLQAFTLALLTLTGLVETWHIIVLAFMLGLVHAMEMPSRHAFLAGLVPTADLANAIALNSTMFNAARFVGPAIAGWLVALTSEGEVFLINGLTFLAVIAGLSRIPADRAPEGEHRGRLRALHQGIAYAWEELPVRGALLLLVTVSFLGNAPTVLMPVFVGEVFDSGPELLGTLVGAAGAGALAAALRLAHLAGRQHLERHIGAAALSAGIAMGLFASLSELWLVVPAVVLLGFSLTTTVASVNTLIQLRVPNSLRGRVMSLFSVTFIGLTSVGNLFAGSLAHYLTAPRTVFTFGVISVVVAGLYWRWAMSRDESAM